MATPAVPPTAGEHWFGCYERLGDSPKRLRLFQPHHVHLPAAFRAPRSSWVQFANDPDPVGFQGDFGPFV